MKRFAGIAGSVVIAAIAFLSFNAWQTSAQRIAVAKAITGGDPARAPQHLRRYGCAGCHTISGVAGADGKVAPPLTDMRARVFVGGVTRNSADNLVRWIVSPQSFSQHSAMPPTGIGEREARDIAAYLYAR